MLIFFSQKGLRNFAETLNHERSPDGQTAARREMKAKFGGRIRHLLTVVPAVALCASMLLASSAAQAVDGTDSSSDTGKTVSITINKKWQGDTGHEDKRPSSLTVAIRNKQTGVVAKTVELTSEEGWTTTVDGLPYVQDSDGHLGYEVSETTVPDGYEQSCETMTNQTTKDLELWTLATGLDKNSLNGESFVILTANEGDANLLRAEGPTDGVLTATQHVFTDPLTVNGTTYESYGYIGKGTDGYTVAESLGWTAVKKDDGYVLQSNMLKNDPQLNKTAYLVVEKNAYKLVENLNKATKFKYDTTSGALASGNVTLYPYQQTDQGQMDDYASTVTITNTYTATDPSGPDVTVGDGPVTLNVSKKWDDDDNAADSRPDSVTMTVLADGQPVKDANGKDVTVTLSADSDWKGTVTGLDRYDADGNEITYSLQEQSLPDGYAAEETGRSQSVETNYYWVQATTFGESAKDNDQYLVVARDVDDKSKWLGMHVEDKNVSWTNKEGHSANQVNINNQKITVNGVTYESWISQEEADKNKDCLWNTHYVGDSSEGQSGKDESGNLIVYHSFVLESTTNPNQCVKVNGQGDLTECKPVSSAADAKWTAAEEAWLHYGIPLYAQGVTLSNPKEEYPYVIGNTKHYYLLNKNHTGDGDAQQSSVMRIYKKVPVEQKTVNVEITNTYTKETTGSVSLHKLDENGQDLSGAEFTLYSTGGTGTVYQHEGVEYKQVGEAKTTGKDGLVKFTDLKADENVKYVLVETKAPQGYVAIDPITFTLPLRKQGSVDPDYQGTSKTDGEYTLYYDITYEAVDHLAVTLPQTAGPGILPTLTAGIMLMGVSALLVMRRHVRGI